MMPYRTTRLASNVREIAAEYGNDDAAWPAFMFNFAHLEAYTLDIVADDNADDPLRALAGWWSSRGGTFLHRYQTFYSLLPPSVIDVWWSAYEATRDEVDVKHPEKPTDPEA